MKGTHPIDNDGPIHSSSMGNCQFSNGDLGQMFLKSTVLVIFFIYVLILESF